MKKDLWGQAENLFNVWDDSLEEAYIFMYDLKTRRFKWSRSAMEYFNIPQIDTVSMNDESINWLHYIHPEDRQNFIDDFSSVISGQKKVHSCEYRARNRYGIYNWLKSKGRVLFDDRGEPLMLAGAMTNLGNVGKYDSTTNLKNIYEFRSDLSEWITNAKEENSNIGVMLIGINGFGYINEKYTYMFGNKVLRIFSRFLREQKSPNMELYRMDGDKFACIWPNTTKQELNDCFDRYQDIARHSVIVEGVRIRFGISGGALMLSESGEDIEDIHRNLEQTLHSAKKNGKRGLEFFSSDVMQESLQEIETMSDIIECINDDYRGFYLCYQPIIDCQTGGLDSCEALLRWTDKNGKKVSPTNFVPILESTGKIIEVGNWILETGIKQLSEWNKVNPNLKMNINVSYIQFQREEFMYFVMDTLKKYHISPDRLILELTETCKIMDMDGLRSEFEFFRNHGVKVALDDFGTGYASVSSLKELPVDSVKIDHGFVSQLTESQADRHIIEYLINLSQKLGIEVCVEGIENADFHDIVQSYGPDSLQGYYFSYPLEPDSFYKQFLSKMN